MSPKKRLSPQKSRRKAGGRRVKDQVVETTSAALALGAHSGRLVFGAVVVAALLLGVGELRTASDEPAVTGTSAQEISTVAYGCPAFVQRGASSATTVAVTSLPGDFPDGGTREALRLPGTGPVAALAESPRGAWATALTGRRARALLVEASGGRAPGTVAFSASVADATDGGGATVGACPRPAPERWFVGAGSTAQRRTALVLTNTSSNPGVVDVSMYGTAGEVDGVGATGIVVEPQTSRVVRLEQLAAGETEMAVRVVVRRGAVAVAATDASSVGTAAAGSELLPPSALPSNTVTVAGVPAHRASRTLLVANPSERTATVSLSIATNDGVFTPTGLESIDVAPQAVTSVTLPASISARAYSVRMTSDVPVTASVRTTTGSDHAYAVAAMPWEGTAVMPVSIGSSLRPGGAALLVAPEGEAAAQVRLTAHDESGAEVGSADLAAAAGSTTSLDPFGRGGVGVSAARVSYLTVSSDTPVRATAVYTARGLAALPLAPAPVREAAPVVRPGAL
ncbi:DUF5719 family protein [Mumia zhuanghuii]|uniref:Uncharacterized protein n=1 Tax=Mumia zhuanghuii TaxID=2585211 RepID=A0A5C4MD20_9ACTN|nr:DUF5719 family protein [Mumia zhuanghuii]TNC31227.1 hypothetical protein FHE65_31595 [Mumia zhuanghuii]TNC44912.1 hypothetical protein FHE65_15905 [Mumia zhuanghuii]